jgi:hypothetical protein
MEASSEIQPKTEAQGDGDAKPLLTRVIKGTLGRFLLDFRSLSEPRMGLRSG